MVKLPREAVLELETRRKVYGIITSSPGLHFREIERRVGLAYGTLQYHLEFLIRHNLVEEEKGKDYSRYFPTDFKSIKERELISLLRQKTLRHLLLYLLENPNARNKDLADKMDLSASTVSWHTSRLVHSGAVIQESKDNETLYRVSEPEVVTRLLIRYRSSFIDKIVDKFIELWEKENLKIINKPKK